MKNSPSDEIANDAASMASVGPGPIAVTRNPASAGPTMNEAENAVSRIPLPRASCDRPTRFGIEAR